MYSYTISIPDNVPYDLKLYGRKGDTLSIEITCTGKDYSGYEFKSEVRNFYTNKRMIEFTPILVGVNKITLNKGADQMALVPPGLYFWDLAAINTADTTDQDIIEGHFQVYEDVTSNIVNLLEDGDGDVISG